MFAAFLLSAFASVRSSIRTRAALQIEILTLRHQLTVLQRSQRGRVRLTSADWFLWVYLDKLDGQVAEEFWLGKTQEWQREEQRTMLAIRALAEASPDRILDGVRILELANKAYFLYLRQNHAERAKLLKIVLSNCRVDSVSLYPTYRKPFDLILGAAKTGEWYARGDSNTRPTV